jgi:hypothetical protein
MISKISLVLAALSAQSFVHAQQVFARSSQDYPQFLVSDAVAPYQAPDELLTLQFSCLYNVNGYYFNLKPLALDST